MTDVFEAGVTVDLFGNVVRAKRRGRPPHEASAENRRKVLLWLACDRSDDEIAEAFGITTKTLNKHYFHELAYRRTARMELEAKNMTALVDQVDKGNASAIALLDKKLDRWTLTRVGKNGIAKAPKLGKKEQAIVDARNIGSGSPLSELMN